MPFPVKIKIRSDVTPLCFKFLLASITRSKGVEFYTIEMESVFLQLLDASGCICKKKTILTDTVTQLEETCHLQNDQKRERKKGRRKTTQGAKHRNTRLVALKNLAFSPLETSVKLRSPFVVRYQSLDRAIVRVGSNNGSAGLSQG